MSRTDLATQRDKLIADLRQGRIRGSSYDLAKATVSHLRKAVAHGGRCNSVSELLSLVRSEGQRLAAAQPTEFVVANMTLRVLKLIREEKSDNSKTMSLAGDQPDSLVRQLTLEGRSGPEPQLDIKDLRTAVIATLGEFLQEMENSRENIATQAVDHIKQGDVVLTFGDSLTVAEFLKFASKKRRFEILVGENAPAKNGVTFMERLTREKSKLEDIRVIPDTSFFSSMCQVTKVVLGAHSVLADGGFVAPAGTYTICLAAKHYSVPVIVCAAFYKLTPRFLSADDQESFNRLVSPSDVVPFSEGEIVSRAEVYNPLFDYIPPELVSLYIMHTCGNAPSYVYRQLGEYFHPEDISSI